MAKKPAEENFVRIEAGQAALRLSIEQAREFAEESERLVRKHRTAAQPKPPNPAS